LLRVPVHLIIDAHTIPISAIVVRVSLVQCVSGTVQGDGLVEKLIVRSSLDLQRQMIPSITDRVAGKASMDPVFVDVVPDIPLMTTSEIALMTVGESFSVEELVDVEL
jgi:hypothetical protein